MQVVSIATNLKMMPLKKYILVATVAIVVFVALYAYKEYNRKATNLQNTKPDETISATDLVAAFENDETKANTKFNGKTILVTGTVAEIENQQDTLLNIYLGSQDALHKVSCSIDMRNKQKKQETITGKQISIKGICTGFLADVEMNRCVIVNEK